VACAWAYSFYNLTIHNKGSCMVLGSRCWPRAENHTLYKEMFLKCIWHEISYFLKWKNSLSCSVTYFSVSCFYGLFPRYICLICKWAWICPLIYDVTLVASSTYKCINSKNCWYQFTFFSSVSSHLPVSEVWNYHLGS
jgi:hypothetical protein